MNAYPALRRGLAVGLTLAVFAAVVAVAAWPNRPGSDGARPAEEGPKAAGPSAVAMFGVTVHRNMVNPTEKNIPAEWDAKTGTNIKWKAALGSKSYALTVHGGKVLVGTNNDAPR